MEVNVTCFFCCETFEAFFDLIEGYDTIIIDCDICCNTNLISYEIINNKIGYMAVSSGND